MMMRRDEMMRCNETITMKIMRELKIMKYDDYNDDNYFEFLEFIHCSLKMWYFKNNIPILKYSN